jgi:hypothetical protein
MTEPEPNADETDRVRRLLAGAPTPTMPPEVAARLDAALAEESRRRTEQQQAKGGFVEGGAIAAGLVDDTSAPDVAANAPTTRAVRPGTGPTPALLVADPPAGARWRRPVALALVAGVTAGAVGLAGYTLAATAGLNEPVANSILQVQSSDLADQARAIAAARNLSAHTFSGAWRCARDVTDGRITGLTPAVVDGSPALLVYTSARGEKWVTVVTGCPAPGALARESVRLSS